MRATVLGKLKVAKCKTAEARVSQLRAFVGKLDPSDVEWLREHSGPEFVEDLRGLRESVDLLLDVANGGEAA